KWLAKAKEHAGSWWPDWLEWLKAQDSTEGSAREPGGGKLTPLEDAPGSYVKVPDWRLDVTRSDGPGALKSVHQEGSPMYRKMLLSMIAGALFFAGPALGQELTGTLKKIKDSGAITLGHRESSVPFSYYDDKQQVVGYAMDLCARTVDGVKSSLKLPTLEGKLNPVTSATRIPLIANGTVDLECGSTTNNLERQKQVSFTITHFVTANRFVSKKAANLKTVDDLKG